MELKKQILIGGISLGVLIMGFGITKLLIEEYKLLKSYCYKIKNIVFKTISNGVLYMTVDILVRNQSDLDIDVIGYDMDVYVENIKVSTLASNKKQTLKAKTISTIKLVMNIDLNTIFSDGNSLSNLILKFATDADNVMVGIKGKITARHWKIAWQNLPVDITMSIADSKQDDPTAYKCNI